MLTSSHVVPFGGTLGQLDITGADLLQVALVLSETAKSGVAIADRAVTVLDTLPQRLSTTVEAVAETAGRGAGRGFGWGILPPLLLGAGAILAMVLIFDVATESL